MAQLTIEQLPQNPAARTDLPSPRVAIPPAYENLAEFLHAIGDIPPQRVLLNPWPGTATEQDMIVMVDRDKRMVELIDGTLVEKALGSIESIIAISIATAISNFIKHRKLGVVAGEGFLSRMYSGRVRMPDVSFVSFDRFPDRKFPRTPITPIGPDLAVEVLSDSNTRAEMNQKLKEYFKSGTRLAWIVDPETETIEVYLAADKPDKILQKHDSLDGGGVLPGFSMTLHDVFHPYE